MKRPAANIYTLNYDESVSNRIAWTTVIITLFIISMILYAGANWKKLTNKEKEIEITQSTQIINPSLPNNSNRI